MDYYMPTPLCVKIINLMIVGAKGKKKKKTLAM